MKKVTILGAGPAGIMSAITLKNIASSNNEKIEIIVIEKNDRVGKKILSTGNGKCNYSNINLSCDCYNDPVFVKPIIESFSPTYIQNWFLERGLLSKVDSEGRIYPITENASSVLDLLRMELEKNEIRTITSFSVKSIKQKGNGYILSDGKTNLFTDVLVIATGGDAAPVLGSSGDAFRLLEPYKVSITKRYPGLVGLKANNNDIRGLSGLRVKGFVKLIYEDKVVESEKGEIQFKDDGISGIVVMNMASKIMRNHNLKLVIDFMPNMEIEEIISYLNNKIKMYPNFEQANLLVGMLPNMLAIKILKDIGANFNSKIKHLDKSTTLKIAKLIKHYPITYTSPYGFERAQVTVGGVDLEEVTENLELKKLPNVYLCGEVLDIDGICGGYNLHFAFASGAFVANSILNKK